jgi:predicted DsbA family dithiol-disulfide isomerase
LEKKLEQKNFKYDVVDDVEKMREAGVKSVPMMMVDGTLMTFVEANKWINQQEANQ